MLYPASVHTGKAPLSETRLKKCRRALHVGREPPLCHCFVFKEICEEE